MPTLPDADHPDRGERLPERSGVCWGDGSRVVPQAIIIGLRKPNQVPEFGWVNTLLGNLKTSFSGAYHAFNFARYGTRYLAAFAYRFNRRFHLDTLPARLLAAAAAIGPRPARWLRQAKVSC